MADLRIPNLSPQDARVAEFVFEFVQFLLDDDTNLTPAGNLAAPAKKRLRTRLEELITAEQGGGSAPGAGGADELVIDPNDVLGAPPTAEKKEQP
jgi:hypothetical protein